MQIGRSLIDWTSWIAFASSSGSSVGGPPMFPSSTSAPPSACAMTSLSIADRSPARSCSWKIRRPVGLIRSPIRQNRWSWPSTTSRVADRRTVWSGSLIRGPLESAGWRSEAGEARSFVGWSCGDLRAPRLEHRLGLLDRGRGVGGVPVGADGVGVLLGDRGAADHDHHGVAEAGLLEGVDVGLEHRHRGGEERREADDVGLVLLDRGHELLRRDLDAEVDDLEAGALEHDVDEVLADVV